jgi:Acetyltransferase (GNAT) domain
MKSQDEHLSFFYAPRLDEDQIARWRDFADRVPWAHYRQDPAWAETERYGSGMTAREPWFFWVESHESVCLTAIGVRRRLPVPGYVFWEFNKGPTFLDSTVFDAWLPWLLHEIRRGGARVRVQPSTPLDQGGDDVETVLERHGFVRRRLDGGWATLRLDLTAPEDEIVAGFRPTTQQCIRKSRNLGITIEPEDARNGWRTIAALQADLSLRAPVPLVDEAMMERISRQWLRDGSGGNVLVARHDGEALAAALVVTYHGTADLVMMPSARRHRELSAGHLLLWEVMRWSRQHGCTTFDLGGYSLVAQQGDALSGVNLFKRGFASLDHLTRSVAMHEIVLSRMVAAMAATIRRLQARPGRTSSGAPSTGPSV